MIVLGLGMIIFGIGNGGIATGISNLWNHGGFFPNGMKGVLLSLQMVMFAYLGIEMIGVTAGEVKNPEKTLTKAIDNVLWRILIFTSELCLLLCLFILGQRSEHKEAHLF